ncbi:Bcr/CflA family efflux MFS transporter [Rubrivivax sp. JA1024]|nr:Bcr/CflA family efflux MFS transporter [Rubrivivax sp. JA1024]
MNAAASVPAARAPVSHALAAVALALLLGLQPVSTDVMLPALPLLARELAAPMSAVQLTMAALILAFGIAQLVWGPVADRVGRRPVLLAGLALYTAASAGAALAADVGTLVAWRALQGVALAAAVVVARAMLRDLYEPHEGARVMALALSGLGLIAIASPTLGGWVAGAAGWRATLAVVGLAGAATLAFVVLRLPETIVQKNPQATAPGPLLAAWAGIARHRVFVAWALLTSCTYGGLFTILAGSSFVYMDRFGLGAGHYGLAMATGSLAYLGGTVVCRRWILHHGLSRSVRRAALFTLAGGLGTAAAALAGVESVWAYLLPQWLFCFGHGIHQPCGQAGAVGPFPRSAGAASALAGFVLAFTAFCIGQWLGVVLGADVRPYALTVAFWAAATTLVAWTLVRRLPEVPHR